MMRLDSRAETEATFGEIVCRCCSCNDCVSHVYRTRSEQSARNPAVPAARLRLVMQLHKRNVNIEYFRFDHLAS